MKQRQVAKDEKNLRTFAGYHHFRYDDARQGRLEVGTNGKMLLTVWIAYLSPSEVGLKHRRHCRQKNPTLRRIAI
ncbi:hypothetical protein IH970_09255 [candidate division KSB1 bacterium]|nr:hypothetical protein [candidate division KSB1 bacterium]